MTSLSAAAYVRVSTDEQANGYGLEVQRERIAEFCRRERIDLAGVYEDAGVPGSTPLAEREGLSAALELVRSSQAEALVVARYDRLARDTLQALLIEQAFRAAGGRVLYAEGLNGDDEGLEFMRTVMHAMAQEQKRQLVARLAAARRAKAARGGYAGGRPPLGYEARGGQLRPRDDEAQVVRWIFERCADDGWSTRAIAAALDEAGTLERRWHATEVRRILRRDVYKRGPAGARIVDPRLWNRAEAALAERRRS